MTNDDALEQEIVFQCADCEWIDDKIPADDDGPKCPECGGREIDKESPEYGI